MLPESMMELIAIALELYPALFEDSDICNIRLTCKHLLAEHRKNARSLLLDTWKLHDNIDDYYEVHAYAYACFRFPNAVNIHVVIPERVMDFASMINVLVNLKGTTMKSLTVFENVYKTPVRDYTLLVYNFFTRVCSEMTSLETLTVRCLPINIVDLERGTKLLSKSTGLKHITLLNFPDHYDDRDPKDVPEKRGRVVKVMKKLLERPGTTSLKFDTLDRKLFKSVEKRAIDLGYSAGDSHDLHCPYAFRTFMDNWVFHMIRRSHD